MSTDGTDPDEAEGTREEVEFEIEATAFPRGRTQLTVRQGGSIRHRDVVDLNREADRRKIRSAVTRILGVDPGAVEARLLDVLANLEAAGAEGEASEADAAPEAATLSDAQTLLALAEDVDLFHTADGKAYATVPVNGHAETLPLASKGFKQWMAREFRRRRGRPTGMEAMGQALLALEAEAQLDGPVREVFVRTAEVADPADRGNTAVYIDLGDDQRRCVRVTRDGWTLHDEPTVRFRRPRGMHPLPEPRRGGSVADLRRYVNVPGRRGWRLFLAWLLAAMRGRGPYPVLVISGEMGSAKTGTARVARELVDPHEVVDRSPPKDIRDLMIAASNCGVLSFDNVSYIDDWFSDALCRLSTGAAFSTRELYSDADEALFKCKKPVILNGIPDAVTQGDLLDRSVLLHLRPISARHRVEETAFWADFAEHRATLFGALLDLMVAALRIEPTVRIARLPRMADFAVWGEAVCRAAGEAEGAFLRSYRANLMEAATIVLDSSTVAGAVLELMRERASWEGEAGDLLELLPAFVGSGTGGRGRHWPQTPRGMGSALRRIVPALRARGIVVEFERETGHDRRRLIMIRRAGQGQP